MLLAVLGLLFASQAMAGSAASTPVVTVGSTGRTDFLTLQAALDHAPPEGETVLLQPGTYREKLHITTPNVHLIGLGGSPEQTVLSWDDAAVNAGGTGRSGTLTVNADGFEAENLTIENTWEREHTRTEQGSQAVALLLSSDRAVLDRVRLLGAQDTLYANSRTCRDVTDTMDSAQAAPCEASREFFNDCFIEGHVDFIFGDGLAVFDGCTLHTLHHPDVMLTAQSRHAAAEHSGYYFLHCRITGEDAGEHVYLGRPWRAWSTVLFYDTAVERPLDPAGWREWDGRLATSTYREYDSHGPGVDGGHRIVASPPLTPSQRHDLTPAHLLAGTDHWQPEAAVAALRAMQAKAAASFTREQQ